MFGLTKVDGKNASEDKSSDNNDDCEVLNDADLIFPNYLVGEDGNTLHGLNLDIEPAKHMKDLMNTKINFANYQLSDGNSSISIPNYMKKPKRPAQSGPEAPGFDHGRLTHQTQEDLPQQSQRASTLTHLSDLQASIY